MDENLHAIGGAALVNTALQEQQRTEAEMKYYSEAVIEAANQIREHEYIIIDKTFEEGKQEGITATQLKHFVDSRLNLCLAQLKLPKIYNVTYNPIAEWFYKGINDYTYTDFFTGIGREYQRDWVKDKFIWVPQE